MALWKSLSDQIIVVKGAKWAKIKKWQLKSEVGFNFLKNIRITSHINVLE